ncbi:hypothetical protein SSZBM1_167 [Synechococcus phage S-SZBM1]|uniref:Uncharacterized protein n=1 Tax=Synechococcus phage S-SZBM1 TaxID=2926475 RepID=A0AC61TSU2_9CAUD|nr:hypothetical protein PP650_gp109 [Synechococcus phage S-SZBM1]UNH61284.1 hypothetical protein SSZBM1_167 [Synechococcus phage S-SZBM1]
MYVLVDKKSGGVYAVKDDDTRDRVVQLFVDEDDAERYHGHLIASDYKRTLEVVEVEEDVVRANCTQYGYSYTIITPNDIVFPPLDD